MTNDQWAEERREAFDSSCVFYTKQIITKKHDLINFDQLAIINKIEKFSLLIWR